MTKTESIQQFLNAKAPKDLAELYNYSMEVQVNVAQDNGERVEKEFQGRRWHGWTDGLTTWKSFRVPHNAATTPEYTDSEMKWDLAAHAEGIGMTGWDWEKRVSRWVAYDFDSIVNHKGTGLDAEDLLEIRKKLEKIDYVTIRTSTSGKGFHIYVFLDEIPTQNHSEHAALARAILSQMSAMVQYNFLNKVDTCGGNMWVWHRKLTPDGLRCLKQGDILQDAPLNWRDHVKVVTGARRRNLPSALPEDVTRLASQKTTVRLDSEHTRLLEYLQENALLWSWDSDLNMLITHTAHLQAAHEDLELKGFFKTSSPATNIHEQNCFCFPERDGAWSVRRYTPGCTEHPSWDQDGSGWTACYLNRESDLRSISKAFGAVEDPKGGYVFRESEIAAQALSNLGVTLDLPMRYAARKTILKQHKDGRLVVELDRDENDTPLEGWHSDKKRPWSKIFNRKVTESYSEETVNHDELIRSIVSESGGDLGWVLRIGETWVEQPVGKISSALASLGYTAREVQRILGTAVFNAWTEVSIPFEAEYPGNRRWNRKGAQLAFKPSFEKENLHYPHWLKILEHCGKGLTEDIQNHPWCKANGIRTGADYLKCWIASMFQHPFEPLPYLFFYGVENCGKSILHEALSLLIRNGVMEAKVALTSTGAFNAELVGVVLCYLEEIDLGQNNTAYQRMKHWVTSKTLLIHPKGETPYEMPNTSHWMQFANPMTAVPVFSGDTRITVCNVDPLEPEDVIPKKLLLSKLSDEAPDFLAAILKLEIPHSPDRLHIPVVESSHKRDIQQLNDSSLSNFLQQECTQADGYYIKYGDFYDLFIDWLDPSERHEWTKRKFGKDLKSQGILKGRRVEDSQFYLGNIRINGQDTQRVCKRFELSGEFLVAND